MIMLIDLRRIALLLIMGISYMRTDLFYPEKRPDLIDINVIHKILNSP